MSLILEEYCHPADRRIITAGYPPKPTAQVRASSLRNTAILAAAGPPLLYLPRRRPPHGGLIPRAIMLPYRPQERHRRISPETDRPRLGLYLEENYHDRRIAIAVHVSAEGDRPPDHPESPTLTSRSRPHDPNRPRGHPRSPESTSRSPRTTRIDRIVRES